MDNTQNAVAETILRQLGGRRFITMTGANTFIGHPDALTFRLPNSQDGANVIEIRLTPMDLYEVQTFAVRRSKAAPLGIARTLKTRLDGVYCDQLESVIGSITGLATRL